MPKQLFTDSEIAPGPRQLSELKPGEQADVFTLLVSKDRGSTKDGKPYFRVAFRDAARQAVAMIWSDSPFFTACEQEWQPGEFYKLRCKYSDSAYGPQIELDRVRNTTPEDATEGFRPEEYFARSRFDPEEMFAELTGLIQEHVAAGPLQTLVFDLLQTHSDSIKSWPAASRNHHAYHAGYLEHVLSVTRTSVYLADKYRAYYSEMQPPLDKSLVVTGAVLHDIGKLQELNARPQGATYSAHGRLIGHILLGRDLVRAAAAKISDLPPETLLRLEHIIVSHQNLPEWGSPIAPHTPEALLVHYADEIDAKFHMVAMALEAPDDSEEFTSRDNPLRRAFLRKLS
ncbi:MAG: 3'-5' exoribonuclease YhaM family protein [Planctomycetaceae bacterium]